MCEHVNKKQIKTDGINHIWQCLDCQLKWVETEQPKKKGIKKLLK